MNTSTFSRKLKLTVLLTFFLVFLLGISCNSYRKGSAGDYIEIIYGTGGGVTGAVEEYHLTRDGSLKKGNELVTKMSKSKLRKLQKAFDKVDFNKIALDDPSNLYYFLGFRSSIKEMRLTWNDQTHVPDEVLKAHAKLMKATQKSVK